MRRSRSAATVLLLALACAALLAARVAAAPPAQLEVRLARALAVPNVSRARTGALAIDLATGRTVFAQNDALPLAPASNEKLTVTYATLVALGPGFRIQTDVLGEGALRESTWQGDLVLRGSGDPTLSSGGLAELAARVRAAGITRVTGGVVGDESTFDSRRTAPGWKPSFYGNESPPLSALTVDRGRVNGVVSAEPALAAAVAFRAALGRAGVAVAGAARTGVADDTALLLASISSPPLWRILRFMDRRSDNFTAELLVKQLGALEAGSGTTAAGVAVVRRVLAAGGIPLAGCRIADGSGLSRLDRLTADALVGILQAAWANPTLRAAVFAALPIAGRTGTLAHRLRTAPARGRVLAKTGTTAQASSLSGFVSGRFVFAVLQNGDPLATWWAERAEDRFAAVLAAQ